MTAEQVAWLERKIDEINAGLGILRSFILPGGSPAAAHLHLARTVVRRAEREVAALAEVQTINPEALRYLNRLSDCLFVMARRVNSDQGKEVLWISGAGRNRA